MHEYELAPFRSRNRKKCAHTYTDANIENLSIHPPLDAKQNSSWGRPCMGSRYMSISQQAVIAPVAHSSLTTCYPPQLAHSSKRHICAYKLHRSQVKNSGKCSYALLFSLFYYYYYYSKEKKEKTQARCLPELYPASVYSRSLRLSLRLLVKQAFARTRKQSHLSTNLFVDCKFKRPTNLGDCPVKRG